MNIKILTLKILFKQMPVVIQFSPEIAIIHGEMATGKSSIARLIHYCFGGELVYTRALESEFVSVSMEVLIGEYQVILVRERRSNMVEVAFKKNGEGYVIKAPIEAGDYPIFNSDIFNLSDLLLYLLDLNKIMVHRTNRKESKMVRLSFLDLFVYCYLPQDRIDKSFFKLDNENQYVKLKSIDTIRFIIGHYNEKLSELEIELSNLTNEIEGKKEAKIQLREFLEEFDFHNQKEIEERIQHLVVDKNEIENNILIMKSEYNNDTHFVDDLREELKSLMITVNQEESALKDIAQRIEDNEALKSELISATFKLVKSSVSHTLLDGVKFEVCPACGMHVDDKNEQKSCYLCGSTLDDTNTNNMNNDIVKNDLSSRIMEIEESICKLKNAKKRQEKKVNSLISLKSTLDEKLNFELKNYDTKFLARSVELVRKRAIIDTKIDNLKKIVKLPIAVNKLEDDIQKLIIKCEELNKNIEEEHKKINPKKIIEDLEKTYLELLISVGVEEISTEDVISINTNTWRPTIRKGNQEFRDLSFENAGSEGLKTLMNDCFALAIHIVAKKNNLPLPNIIILDSPMSNITRAENAKIMALFYETILRLSSSKLNDVQIIIIDADVYKIRSDEIEITWKHLTKSDPNNPPLIPYLI